MPIRFAVAAVAALALLMPTTALGQAPTVGTYTYFWTNANDATNTPITTINASPGTSVSVRFWLHESGGGTVLSAANTFGLGGYDASYTWAVGGTAGDVNAQGIYITKADGTNAATTATTDVQVNPFTYGSRGFNNTNNGLISNTTAAAINTAKSIQIGKLIGDTTNPANYVKITDGPNSTGNVLLTEMTFTTSAGFTGDTLTGAQRGGTNYLYFVNGSTPLTLDSTISSTSAVLQFLPVPEPFTGFGLCFGTAGLVTWYRRRRAETGGPDRPVS